ncbi:unnamed protein product [Adineta ricciae]|uniref:Vacuolar protein sorting 55 n=1 Tax=Adineta ricciae TaxID=249248 RepID=A0A815FJ40_ADIRI|nr:unnamed protein product [Adineta ricciae]
MGFFQGIKGKEVSILVDLYTILFRFLKGNVVLLAFLASIGLTLLILGCALAQYNWWPTFVIIFYVICPIPLAIGRRCTSDSGYGTRDSSPCADLMWFLTSVIVISAFGLPAVMCRATAIQVGSMGFIMAANVVIFTTIAIYFMTFGSDDSLPSF